MLFVLNRCIVGTIGFGKCILVSAFSCLSEKNISNSNIETLSLRSITGLLFFRREKRAGKGLIEP